MSQYEKIRNVIFAFYVTVFLLVIFPSGESVSACTNIDAGDWLSYNVVSASDTINDFYGTFPPGTYYGNWSVVIDDIISFNITSVQDGVVNGTLFFGNALENETFYNVRNMDTAFGLGLGIYPWNGGFLANSSDWDNIMSSIQATNTTVTIVDNYNHPIEGDLNTYSVIHFNTSDYYGQFSNFYYHKESGVLLKALTSFGLYELEISLNATNLELDPYIETVKTNIPLIIYSIFLLPALSMIKKKGSNNLFFNHYI